MLNLFISYSHKDEGMVSNFINHLSPLKANGTISEWYDRKLESGQEFENNINTNLSNADIICLMISADFLSSEACCKEVKDALELQTQKGIRIIPLILRPCHWYENKEISNLLAIPTDGKAISTFSNQDDGWFDAIGWILRTCKSIIAIKSLKIDETFNSFLNSTDVLSKSHKDKGILNLHDIFVYPRLKIYDKKENSHKYNSENLQKDLLKYGKIIIAGENQSGKTTLCKVIFRFYRNLNYIPIYLDDENKYFGNPRAKLVKAFAEQYGDTIESFDIDRIIPIVDNFHLAKYQEKYIEEYCGFQNQIIVVDDIFGLNIRNQSLIKQYNKFKIIEFSPLERNELIKKWIHIQEDPGLQINQNYLQQSIDEKTELIEGSLGMVFGKGIMPSYPFFILSLLSAQDTQKPLDSDITSQGQCYQALIYLYLKREGVKNDQMDIYSNFLTELAYWIYDMRRKGIDNDNASFMSFLVYYKSKFNLPIKDSLMVKTLAKVNICKFNSLGDFGFCYTYIYYFFVAKYFSEHLEKKDEINAVLSNLHKDENAYITVFIAHHTKSNYILDELLLNAEILFEKHKPATLDTNELSFFDKHEDKIIQAILPSFQHNAEEERKKFLIEKTEIEDKKQEVSNNDVEKRYENNDGDDYIEIMAKLRLAIKTVEVMGLIIKNRSGSLDLNRLEYIYEQGLKVLMRILSSFIEIIKDEEFESFYIDLLKERINNLIDENEKEISIEKIEKLTRDLYWNVNFGVLHAYITKAIHSLGSSNLLNIAQSVSNKEGTPSAFIINHGIRMWYSKNLKIDQIANRINESDFSKTAERLIKHKIVEHCRLHKIDFKDLMEIEKKLNMQKEKMLADRSKNKNNI